jgi:hypothetical protein
MQFKSSIRAWSSGFALAISFSLLHAIPSHASSDCLDWEAMKFEMAIFSGPSTDVAGSTIVPLGNGCSTLQSQIDSRASNSFTIEPSINFWFKGSRDLLPESTICRVSVLVDNQPWITGNTTTEPFVGVHKSLWSPVITDEHIRSLSVLIEGKDYFDVSLNSTCDEYSRANQTLTLKFYLVEQSFDLFKGISINKGTEFTNGRQVEINLSFESGVPGQVMISNDGGFSAIQRETYDYSKNTISWKLSSSVDERMVKTVYVKYRYFENGQLGSWSETLTDDIILDTVAPKISVTSASLQSKEVESLLREFGSGNANFKVRLSAKDDRSGLAEIQYSNKPSNKNTKTLPFAKSFNANLKSNVSTIYLRVRDGAGNWSKWSKVPVVKEFLNCKALNKVYPGGVSKSSKAKNKGGKTKYQPKVDAKLYKANSTKDRDKDGIACER